MKAEVDADRGRLGAVPVRARAPRWSMARSDARFAAFAISEAIASSFKMMGGP